MLYSSHPPKPRLELPLKIESFSLKAPPPKESKDQKEKNGNHETPAFQILDINGKPPESLIHCFLERSVISIINLPPKIKAKNGKIYKAVYDNVSWKEGDELIKVFISFQQHSYGNFAIIRNLTERPMK